LLICKVSECVGKQRKFFFSFCQLHLPPENFRAMKTRRTTLIQLFLRLSIALCYLSAVADRLGLWGPAGTKGVSWGNWENFVAYSHTLNAFASPLMNNLLAIMASILEIILPVLLLVGYQIRRAAAASGVLLSTFALAMTFGLGAKAPLDYSVWTAAAASFALSIWPKYRYSIDDAIVKR
jgi:uncharacterized membrane protein YphA (DoxX/SURF4 family)